MKNFLVVGGANGIGLSIAKQLTTDEEVEKVYVVDKSLLSEEFRDDKIECFQFDLTSADYCIFDQFTDIDGLMITAGFGRLELFENISEEMISTYFNVNTIAVIRVIKRFYNRLL